MDAKLEKWINEYGHLPPFFRVKENRENVFAMIYTLQKDNGHEVVTDGVDPEIVMNYVYDYFFKFMAIHGFVLAHSRKSLNFHDIESTTAAYLGKNDKGLLPHMDRRIEVWRKELNFLPPYLRDFHNQKDLFKVLHWVWMPHGGIGELINFRSGMTYMMDGFLWTLARHGLVIYRSSARLPFEDLDEKVSALDDQYTKALMSMLTKP